MSIEFENLVDITSIEVNPELSKNERIKAFVEQIKNLYLFKCGSFVVSAKFADNGITLENCLQRIFA
ncbi:MAG: hypothetical protein LBM93_04875 [Oscillospiraceae bacterium]|jgi:hypothetical protein|nr:hypothetical protein [Oscillospiraceae bacterium]